MRRRKLVCDLKAPSLTEAASIGCIDPTILRNGIFKHVIAGCAGAQEEGADEEVLDDKEIAEVEKADAEELGEGVEGEEEGVEMEEGADAADDDEEVRPLIHAQNIAAWTMCCWSCSGCCWSPRFPSYQGRLAVKLTEAYANIHVHLPLFKWPAAGRNLMQTRKMTTTKRRRKKKRRRSPRRRQLPRKRLRPSPMEKRTVARRVMRPRRPAARPEEQSQVGHCHLPLHPPIRLHVAPLSTSREDQLVPLSTEGQSKGRHTLLYGSC